MSTARRARSAAAAALAAGALLLAAAPAQATSTDRWSGADRHATAAAVSSRAFPDGADDVVVVNGTSSADALAAAPLAAAHGAPLLTTTSGQLPDATREELARLRPDVVWVVGGPAVVSDAVVGELGGYAGVRVERIAGADRYDTAAQVSQREFTGSTHEVWVASGEGFADALAAGAAGAAQGSPLVLTAKGSLPPEARAAIDALAPTRITVVGGTSVVSPAVEAQLEADWPGAVHRISGDDRYGTAAEVARRVWTSSPQVLMASGANFPDALAGAALGAPLLLSRPDCLPQVTADARAALGATSVVGLGGAGVLSEAALSGTVCGTTPAPAPSAAPGATPSASPSATPSASPSASAVYANCDAVRAAGKAPIRRGDPGFQDKFDGDGDGVGCER